VRFISRTVTLLCGAFFLNGIHGVIAFSLAIKVV